MPILEPAFARFILYAQQKREYINEEDTAVEFVIKFSERARISGNTHTYTDPYILVQLISGAQGACFIEEDEFRPEDIEGIVGTRPLDAIPRVPPCLGIALLDAFYSHINSLEQIQPIEIYEFSGLASEKSIRRAIKLVELAKVQSGSRVALIGVIADIVRAVIDRGGEIRAADLALVGANIHGVPVQKEAAPLVEWADIVIMTGSTLRTNTLYELLQAAKQLPRHVLIYTMSGSNIAPRYLDYGADVVTAETFPYYWYANVVSKMSIYRL